MRTAKKETLLCFPTPIWSIMFEDYQPVNEAIRNELSQLDWDRIEKEAEEQFDEIHTFSEDRFITIEQVPSMRIILDFFLQVSHEIADELNWDLNGRRFVVSRYWVHITPPGDITQAHSHRPSLLSGVYYVDTPQNCGDVVFINDNPYIAYGPAVQAGKSSYLGGAGRQFKSREGKMLVFPAWLQHQVPRNKSGRPRISISFNGDLSG
jgi:uncharacterized protein (TIGR02466 family)